MPTIRLVGFRLDLFTGLLYELLMICLPLVQSLGQAFASQELLDAAEACFGSEVALRTVSW